MNKLILSGLALSTLLLSGCASIVSKSDYTMNIKSQPEGADIAVSDDKGKTYHQGTTPTTVTLSAGAGFFQGRNYSVTFRKDGYAEKTVAIQRGVDGWYVAGNFVFGGLIGWFIVDPATGAMWTLPKEVSATLNPQSANLEADTVRIVSLEQIPSRLKPYLVPVP